MSLNQKEVRMFRLVELCYCYIWKFPVKWNSPYYTKPTQNNLFVHSLAVLLLATYGFCSLASAIFIKLFQPEQGLTHVIIMGVVGAIITTLVIVSLLGPLNPKSILFVEGVMQTADSIFKGE